jgi:type II secretory pathway predicted ATPase ExeA
MLALKPKLAERGITQAALALGVGVSSATISLAINRNQWPKEPGREELQGRIEHWLEKNWGAFAQGEKEGLWLEVAPSSQSEDQPGKTPDQSEKMQMLTHAEWLTHQAKRHFGLFRDPFRDDVESPDDVFLSAEHRYAIEAMNDALHGHRFVAVVGESGSGKTIMRRLFLERNRDPKKAAIVMPYILDAEDNPTRGKPLRGSDIQEAIIASLAPSQSIPRSRQARARRVEELLKTSAASGRRNLLLIEEAHTLPITTLRQLKRLQELDDGMARLIGVLLIGQPELLDKLDIRQNWEAREVIQRCEIAQLRTLDADLEGYLSLKFGRMRKDLSDVLEKDACDAIRRELTVRTQDKRSGQRVTSYVYPLAVNNLLARALNLCAEIGAPKVGAEQIKAAMGG